MALITKTILPLDRFSCRKNTAGKFDLSAEISDFAIRAGQSWICRVFDDACDIGIAVRSHVTGKVEHFYLDEAKKDNEGDLMYWIFKPINAKCTVNTITIFND